MRLRLTVLGAFEARLAPEAALTVPGKKARALLGYLAVRAGQPCPRDTLATLLWAEGGDTDARTSFRQCLASLRRTLAAVPSALVIEGKKVTLSPEYADVDARTFERRVADGTPAALEEAAALYAGDLLEGFESIAAPFEEWLIPERERLRELALEALARLLRHQSDAAAPERAIQTALRLLALDPLQEAAHRMLMRLYARHGRRASALRQYQTCVEVLKRELGAEPEAETRAVYRDILQQRPLEATRARPRGPSSGASLVGRTVEVERLGEALDAARGRSGRAVVLLGEAGIGKTRLVEELTLLHERRGGRVLVGHCYETEQILPFGPWVEILSAGFRADASALERLDPVWRRELARLLPDTAVPGVAPAPPTDDYLRLFGAVARAVEVLAAAAPLALVVEDAHWGDEMTVRLFGFLARRVPSWPVLVVVTARAEDLGDAPLLRTLLEELRAQPHVASMSLAALSERDTRRLVQALGRAGTRAGALERIARQVWSLSQGNPFVAVETMRALDDGQSVESSALGLPERVRDVIRGRLDRLGARARELVAVAAVIGREFEFALAQRAARLDEREAADGLEEIVRRRVLHSVGGGLDFTHDRVRNVAYGELLPPRRAVLHAAVGAAIESVYADRLEAQRATLGMHYRLGEVWDKALANLRAAGNAAVACSANREALACFDQALDVLGRLPEGRARTELAYDLTMYRAAVYYSLGDLKRIVQEFGEPEALARALDDRLRVGRVAVLRLGCLAAMGDQIGAIDAGRTGLAIAEEVGDAPLQAPATYLLGFAHTGRGDFGEAIEMFRSSSARLEGQPANRRLGQIALPGVLWRAWMVLPLGEVGAFREAITRGEEALRIADETAQPYSRTLAHATLGHLYAVKGEPEVALPLLERAAALCRDYEITVLAPLVFGALGDAYTGSGRISEAVSTLEDVIAQSASLGIMWCQSQRTSRLGEAYARAGRLADAAAAAERALALAEAYGERASRAYALRLRAETVLRQGGDPGRVERDLAEAQQSATTLGMRPLAARCRLELGRLALRVADKAGARTHLLAAEEALRELEMPLWREQAAAELALV